jgi:TonB family protein
VGSTTTAADELQQSSHHPIDALGAAVAASLLVHLATFAALVAAGWMPGGGPGHWSSGTGGPLEVVLASARDATVQQKESITVEAASGALALAMKQVPAAAAPDRERQSSGDATGAPGRPGTGRVPRVVVDDRVAQAKFSEAFDGGPLAEFPREIESSAALPGRIRVPYPPGALAQRREGTVLAYAIVDAQGVVEQTTIVSGQGDFNEAVKSTLARTRMIPARDGGKPVRSYITLEFNFRIDDRAETAAVTASGPSGRP